MNTLREIITRWKTTLAAMPIGQRTALTAVPVAAVIAIAMSFGLGGRSNTTMLDGGRTFSKDEVRQIQSAFRQAGLTGFLVEGQRIRVPERDANRFAEAAASVRGSADGGDSELDKVLAQTNIFATGREKSEQLERARAKELEKIIRGIPGIDDATVLWDRLGVRTSLTCDNKLKATVSVKPKPGVDLTAAVADSLRMTVSGAVADLRPDQVIVLNVATGKVIPFESPADADTDPGSPNGVRSLFHAAPTDHQLHSEAQPRHEKDSRPLRPDDSSDRPADIAVAKTDLATFSLSPASALALLVGIATLALAVLGRAWLKPTSRPRTRHLSTESRSASQIESEPAAESSDFVMETVASATIEMADETSAARQQIVQSAPTDDDASPARTSNEFRFLSGISSLRLTHALRDEHPQTISLVLTHVPPETAETVLDALPNGTRWQVERRMANAQPASSEIVLEVARALHRRLVDKPGATRGRPDATGGLSANADPSGWGMLQDLARLTRPQLRKIVTRVPRSQLVLALKAASADVKARVLDCFGPRQANRLWEEINQLGPLRVRDLDAAQQALAAESQHLFGRAEQNDSPPRASVSASANVPAPDPAANAVRRHIEYLTADAAPAEATETA
jgi:hypothetical protein